MIRSWSEVAAAPVNQNQLVSTVHGVLRRYDLPDLVKSAGANRITIEAPVDAVNR